MTQNVAEPSVRVQIVEDELIVAHDLRQSLEAMGYAVTGIASSEQQAVDLAERERPDLVLMDINLGRGGDGTRAATVIARRFQLPVIYLTAYAGDDIVHKAIQAAPFGYVLKPFEPRELNATIRAALARAEAEKKLARLSDGSGWRWRPPSWGSWKSIATRGKSHWTAFCTPCCSRRGAASRSTARIF